MSDKLIVKENGSSGKHACKEHQKNDTQALPMVAKEKHAPHTCGDESNSSCYEAHVAFDGIVVIEDLKSNPEEECAENHDFCLHFPWTKQCSPEKHNENEGKGQKIGIFSSRLDKNIGQTRNAKRKDCSQNTSKKEMWRLLLHPF